jgi:ribosomal protein S19
MMCVVEVPIACSLTADQAQDRVTEWRALLGSGVDRAEIGEAVARLRLVEDDQTLVRVVDLAEREQACCPFFDFSIELDHGRRWLRVSVPSDAAGVLLGLFAPTQPA